MIDDDDDDSNVNPFSYHAEAVALFPWSTQWGVGDKRKKFVVDCSTWVGYWSTFKPAYCADDSTCSIIIPGYGRTRRLIITAIGGLVRHTLNSYFVAVYGSILILFLLFSEMIALSESLDSSYFCRWVAPQFSQNCGQNLRKVKKSVEKLVRPTSYR